MKPVKFEGCNTTLGAPGCNDISAMIYDHPSQVTPEGNIIPEQRFIITAWKPDEKDIKNILEGGLIYLQVYGGFPPTQMYTTNEEGYPNL